MGSYGNVVTHLQAFQVPVNMPLSQAFTVKNWKAQILVSAKIRVCLTFRFLIFQSSFSE